MHKHPSTVLHDKWNNGLAYLFQVFLLATVYFAAAHVGFFLGISTRGVMPVFLPAGVALSALWLFGIRLWPGIILGLLLTKFDGLWAHDLSIFTILFFQSIGAATQAILSVLLLKYLNFKDKFNRVRDVFSFGVVTFFVAPLIGSTIYAIAFYIQEFPLIGTFFQTTLNNSQFEGYREQIFITTVLNDGIGMFVMTATLLVWRQLPENINIYMSLKRRFEALVLLTTLVSVCVLSLDIEQAQQRQLFLYMILPFVIWAATRFEQHGATLTASLVASLLLVGSLELEKAPSHRDIIYLFSEISFIGITAFTGFIVAVAFSERRLAIENAQRERDWAIITLHSIGDAVITTDQFARVTFINPQAEELLGWTQRQVLNRPISEVFQVRALDELGGKQENPVERCLRGIHTPPHRSFLTNRLNEEIIIENSVSPIRDQQGRNIDGVVIVFHDVSKERHLRELSTIASNQDVVTGLFNRQEFEYRLSALVTQAKTESSSHTFLYLDIDQFSVIVERYGEHEADKLLQQLAATLQKRIRSGDIFARLARDQFAILLKNCPLEWAENVANSFLKEVREQRFMIDEKPLSITASIGAITINAQTEKNSTVLIERAELACYAAKEEGADHVYVHIGNDQKLRNLRHHETQWSNRIRRAITENQLQLYSQPLIAVDPSQNGVCYEILVRLRTDKNELLLPSAFLPVAERYSFMGQIDRWVIQQVFAQLAERPLDKVNDEYIGINLSLLTLHDNSFIHFMEEQLSHLTVSPDKISFELNEQDVLNTLEKSSYFIQALEQLGFSFTLQQFGSGVASFEYLKQRLPIQYLKIDAHLIKQMENDMLSRHIVKAITQIARPMGIKTIATAVEYETLIPLISAIDIDYMQGFAIATPEPFKPSIYTFASSKV
ncbi:PAS domain S-box/diguanylate cyclase (GGDEF) domain-containing protein [Beggiatoa alba B18LD]|uniref:PAS domain S-box/diguanylate cyclase (GGDEF) domain-containing protein n=1 Tax=Beggiatoa alba B18LD TaxID=395493 RepID=I3CEJ2_9GAMM|nr:EAL domain-containing protein [Beggiatoa alba]EIJ42035.1 PAS domain S-box/diguanylate cyclase (GGDEF) domain-containing protein [Beggiatoa alba B18LD]